MVGFYLLFFVNQLKISLNVLKITFNSYTINNILINVTSVWFYLDVGKSIIREDLIKENKIVIDIVTTPIITSLLEIAEKKNCKIISGYKMLIYQAIFAINLWTGKKPSFKTMEKAILEYL